MATSGSVDSGGYNGRHLQFSFNTQSVSVENNTRTIAYSITAVGGSAGYYYHHNNTVWINGVNVYSGGDSERVYNNTVLKSDTFTIDQNQTLTLTVEMYGGIYTYADNINTVQSWSLDELPRYLNNINLYDNGSTLESISARWTCDPARDWTQYSLNGGGWTDAHDSVASDNKSGTFTIGNLAPNTGYNLKVKLRRADSALWSESNEITIYTKNIANVTNYNDGFTINSDAALTVQCSNPSGNQIKYFLDCPAETRRLTSNATTNTTFTWTANQISSMLQYITDSNTKSFKIGVTTLINGNETYWEGKTGTIRVVNSNPIFNDFIYEDINPITLALTGNNQILIKGHSTTQATISTSNKAVAQNYATMNRYELIQGTKSDSEPYSASNNVILSASNVDNNVIIVSAIDSRSNSTSVLKTLTTNYKEYSELIILSAEAKRANNGVGKTVNLTFNGTFWNNSFGYVNNDIDSATYQFKESDSNTWSNEISLSVTTSGSTYSGNQNISGDLGAEGFSVSKSFNIRLIIRDKLGIKTYETSIGYGEPAIAIYKGNVAIGQKYDTTLGGRLQINGDVYVDRVPINKYKYIKATISTAQSVSSSSKVALDTIAENTTNGLITLNNNELIIGAGINTIEVSGLIFAQNVNGNTGDYIWHKIFKQSGNITTSLIGNILPATTNFISGVIPAIPISVTQGDKISMIADNITATGELREGEENTFLMIKIIN